MQKISFYILGCSLLAGCGNPTPTRFNQSGSLAFIQFSDVPSYNFGPVVLDTTEEKTFTLTNVGSIEATSLQGDFSLSHSFQYKGGAFPGEGGTCEETLFPQASCTVVVEFSPQRTGIIEDSLVVTYESQGEAVTGNGPLLRGNGMNPAEP